MSTTKKNGANEEATKRLEELNTKRVETTKLRIARAIKLLSNPVGCLVEDRKLDTAETDIAHAVNLLEAAEQEMTWACEYFNWDPEVCMKLDDACAKLGKCLAMLVAKDAEDYEPVLAGYDGTDALAILGKVLATLIRWFDDSQNLAEG